MAAKAFQIFCIRGYATNNVLSDYVAKLPNRPKPVIADYYNANKGLLTNLLQGLNGKQTLMKIVESYKELDDDEKKKLRERHSEAFKVYQKELATVLKSMPPNIQSELIMNGYVKNPYKIFGITVPKVPSSPYAYFTQIKMKSSPTETNTATRQEVMSLTAKEWKDLPKPQKLEYIERWDSLKEEFKTEMENWKEEMLKNGYSPAMVNLLSRRRYFKKNSPLYDNSLSLEGLKKATKIKTSFPNKPNRRSTESGKEKLVPTKKTRSHKDSDESDDSKQKKII